MIFNANGAEEEPMIWPTMVIAKDGGLSFTATDLIDEPVALSNAAKISYTYLF